MEKMNNSDIVAAVAAQSKKTQKEVREILSAYYDVLRMSLEEGLGFAIPNIGTFKLKTVPSQEGKQFYNPRTKIKEVLPKTKSYNKPMFSISKKLRKDIKEKTLGKV